MSDVERTEFNLTGPRDVDARGEARDRLVGGGTRVRVTPRGRSKRARTALPMRRAPVTSMMIVSILRLHEK